jgi:glycosyltransferase involved in cell wall biosynthesis
MKVNKTKINIYLSKWHIQSSPAFNDAIINILQNHFAVNLIEYEGPDQRLDSFNKNIISIFCMVLPPQIILTDEKVKIIWIPMLDWVWNNSQLWWNCLPKHIKIIAFSTIIKHKCIVAGINYIHLQYYKNPNYFEPAHWKNGNILFYWNRTNLINFDMLKLICSTLEVKEFLIREQMGSNIKHHVSSVPDRIGNTVITKLPAFMPKQDFIKITQKSNIFLAPRSIEGIGMTFIEGIARGCAVFAYDAPTMNEYIIHKSNGYLWNVRDSFLNKTLRHDPSQNRSQKPPMTSYLFLRILAKIEKRLKDAATNNIYGNSISQKAQNWDEIAKLDLPSLGKAAINSHFIGFIKWQEQQHELLDFIAKW